jgi:hypothetical protein
LAQGCLTAWVPLCLTAFRKASIKISGNLPPFINDSSSNKRLNDGWIIFVKDKNANNPTPVQIFITSQKRNTIFFFYLKLNAIISVSCRQSSIEILPIEHRVLAMGYLI